MNRHNILSNVGKYVVTWLSRKSNRRYPDHTWPSLVLLFSKQSKRNKRGLKYTCGMELLALALCVVMVRTVRTPSETRAGADSTSNQNDTHDTITTSALGMYNWIK